MSPESINNIITDNNNLQLNVDSLQSEVQVLKSQNISLKDELLYLKRKIFGQSTERHIPSDNQLTLSPDWNKAEHEEPPQFEKISYDRKKSKKRDKGREDIPAHIPRKEMIIEPDCDTSKMKKMSEKVTEQLEYKPPQFYVTRIVRPVYVDGSTGDSKIICAELPALCIDKGKIGPSLVAHTIVAKCEDHTPLYRILHQVKRDCGMELAKTSILDCFNRGCFWASALVKRMEEVMIGGSYIQIDESFLKVMIKPTAGKSTRGYMWVRHSPERNIVVFDFNRKQNSKVAEQLVDENYTGVVQSDGLVVYDFLGKRKNITHAGCNGHGRRYFEKSLGNDKERSEKALLVYKKIFEIEKIAKDKGLSAEERLFLRKEKTVPIMDAFKKWMDKEVHDILPKSKIGIAFKYTLNRWKELTVFLGDGRVEISNNLIENVIRPLALGRRNWLFASSEKGADNLATAYSIILTCKLHGVNSFKYLSDVFRKLPLRNNGNIDDLLPWNWTDPEELN